jgi:excisionase family DNA binding protein
MPTHDATFENPEYGDSVEVQAALGALSAACGTLIATFGELVRAIVHAEAAQHPVMAVAPPVPSYPESGNRRPSSTSLTVSVREAANLLGVSRTVMYELVAAGKVPTLRIHSDIRIPRRAIEGMVEGAIAKHAAEQRRPEDWRQRVGDPP